MNETSSRSADRFFPGLFSVLCVLEPCLPKIVLVGGWVPYVLARFGRTPSAHEQLLTSDIDLAVSRNLRDDAEKIDTLLIESGLEYNFRSTYDPPVVSYVGSLEGAHVEIEFLSHEAGAEERVVKIGGHLNVQTLHYANILIENTMTIPLLGPDGRSAVATIPTPAAFVLNKGLTFGQRKTLGKKAKDLYYIFEMLENQGESVSEGIATISQQYSARWYRRFKRNLGQCFGRVEGEGVKLIVSQRPSDAFAGMSDDQFAQYIFASFREFLDGLD